MKKTAGISKRKQAIEKAKEKLKQQEFFDPTFDATFKKIFKKKEKLIHFLNAILHLEGTNAIVSVKRLSPGIRLAKPNSKRMKNKAVPLVANFDVHAKTDDGRFIDIEMQRAGHEDFLERVDLYSAILTVNSKISLNKSMKPKELEKHPYRMPGVCSIWICNFPVPFCKSYREDLSLFRHSDVGTSGALPVYPGKRYIIIDLTKPVSQNADSPEKEWIKLFKEMPLAKQIPKVDPVLQGVYRLLRITRSSNKFLTEVATSMIDKDEFNACLYSAIQRSKEEGEAEGLAKGKEEGLAEGRAEGEANGLVKGRAEGEAKAKRKFAARDKKIAKFLRSIGVSRKNISTAFAID